MKVQVTTINNNGNIYNYIDVSSIDKKYISDEYLGLLANQTSVNPSMLSDGLITFSNGVLNGKSIPKMTIYNKDGSRAKMCGNGLRGFILFMLNNDFLSKKEYLHNISILTDSGLLKASYIFDNTSQTFNIETFIGSPNIINNGNTFSIEILSKQLFAYEVNIGNNHIIYPLFAYSKMNLKDLQNYPLKQLFEKTHENLYPESHKINKEEVNVTILYTDIYPVFFNKNSRSKSLSNSINSFKPEKITINKNNPIDIHIRTWERGAEETLSCGTASASSAFLLSQLFFDATEYKMHHKGGILTNKVKENNVFQNGSSIITGKHIIDF